MFIGGDNMASATLAGNRLQNSAYWYTACPKESGWDQEARNASDWDQQDRSSPDWDVIKREDPTVRGCDNAT